MPETTHYPGITLQQTSHQNSIKEKQIKQERSSQGSLKGNPPYCCKKVCHLDPSLLQYWGFMAFPPFNLRFQLSSMGELRNLCSTPVLQSVWYKMLSEIPVTVCKQLTVFYNNSAAVCMSAASDRLSAMQQWQSQRFWRSKSTQNPALALSRQKDWMLYGFTNHSIPINPLSFYERFQIPLFTSAKDKQQLHRPLCIKHLKTLGGWSARESQCWGWETVT